MEALKSVADSYARTWDEAMRNVRVLMAQHPVAVLTSQGLLRLWWHGAGRLDGW